MVDKDTQVQQDNGTALFCERRMDEGTCKEEQYEYQSATMRQGQFRNTIHFDQEQQ